MIFCFKESTEAAQFLMSAVRGASAPLKVVVAAHSFHRTKLVCGEMLESLDGVDHHRRDPGCWCLKAGEVSATFVPVGDGSRVRGFRADWYVLVDPDSIPRKAYEQMVMTASPTEAAGHP